MSNPYESLHVIKDATAQIVEHIKNLALDGLLEEELSQIHKLTAEELGAAVCHSAMLSLVRREQQIAATKQQERLTLTKKLADS